MVESTETGRAESAEGEGRPLAAEIVTTGTEILLGEIVDTNAAWIAQQLREAGVNLYFKTTVGDNEARIRGVIEQAIGRSDVVIVSGGLGPTVDDVTRQAIANATACPLELHPGALATLQARFERFGVTMTPNNLQQAMIPARAILIENPVGTAPGFIVETGRSAVIALPGVPREMKHLMTETVLPYLRMRAGHRGIIRRKVLRTVGIGESTIDDRLKEYMTWSNPTVGLAAHTAQCDVRITARAEDADRAEQMIADLEEAVRAHIGDFIYSTTPDESVEAVVGQLLKARGATVSVVETNTQGQVAERLAGTEHVVAFRALLGEDAGIPVAVSSKAVGFDRTTGERRAREAAEALRKTKPATYGLVLLGSRGADEGVYGTSQGYTWIALAGPQGTTTHLLGFGGSEAYTVVRVGNQALVMLWQLLK